MLCPVASLSLFRVTHFLLTAMLLLWNTCASSWTHTTLHQSSAWQQLHEFKALADEKAMANSVNQFMAAACVEQEAQSAPCTLKATAEVYLGLYTDSYTENQGRTRHEGGLPKGVPDRVLALPFTARHG